MKTETLIQITGMNLNPVFILTFLIVVSNVTISQTPVYYPNFPVIYDSSNWFPVQHVVADFNGDGLKEIACNSIHSNDIRLYIIDKNGSCLPGWPQFISRAWWWMAGGDIDRDGRIDLVYMGYDSIYVKDYLGNNLPGFPVSIGTIHDRIRLALYDLDNDRYPEILYSADNRIYVRNHDGTMRNGWPKTLSSYCWGHFSVCDLDGDGRAEIVVPTGCTNIYPPSWQCDTNFIYIFREDGTLFPNWPVVSDSSYSLGAKAVVIARDPANSQVNLITVSSKIIVQFDTVISRISIYDINANLIRRWHFITWDLPYSPTVGDLDNDNILEIAVGNDQDSVYLFNYYGQLLNGWPKYGEGGWSSQICFGRLSLNGSISVISPMSFSWYNYGYIYAYDIGGQPLPWSPLRPRGLTRWSVSLTDIDNNGDVELVTVCSEYPNPLRYSTINMYKIPGVQFNNRDFPWPMWGHDRYRSFQLGFIPPDEPIGIKPVNTEVPKEFRLYQNYPNPFNPSTTIKFDIPMRSFVKLVVYDILGREVSNLINEALPPGRYKVVWDGSPFPSGVYYCRLAADNHSISGKMILIK